MEQATRPVAHLTSGMLVLANRRFGCFRPAGTQSNSETDDPIKFAMNQWKGQHVSTVVADETLKRMGRNIECVTVGYHPQATAVAEGVGDPDGGIGDALEVHGEELCPGPEGLMQGFLIPLLLTHPRLPVASACRHLRLMGRCSQAAGCATDAKNGDQSTMW